MGLFSCSEKISDLEKEYLKNLVGVCFKEKEITEYKVDNDCGEIEITIKFEKIREKEKNDDE